MKQQCYMDVMRNTKNCLHCYILGHLQLPSAVPCQAHYNSLIRGRVRHESLEQGLLVQAWAQLVYKINLCNCPPCHSYHLHIEQGLRGNFTPISDQESVLACRVKEVKSSELGSLKLPLTRVEPKLFLPHHSFQTLGKVLDIITWSVQGRDVQLDIISILMIPYHIPTDDPHSAVSYTVVLKSLRALSNFKNFYINMI